MPTNLCVKPDNVLIQTIDNEMVLLNLDSEYYFSLDEIGIRFWEVLQDVVSLDQAVDTLEAEYEIDRETLKQDLESLLKKLQENGLLKLLKADY